ncbi:MAG TPA: MFS transporter [Acetobacteraceae bacterium]|nr:MFS transporter [Acetobacteraceae bacterium]
MISRRTRRLRFGAVALLILAGSVNYFDRAALSIGNPAIRSEFHLSLGEMGILLSAFAWSYGLAQIPAGWLIDRFGPRRILGFGMILWSCAQIGAGAVGSLGQFITARVLLGLGESPMYIGGTKVCAAWFELKARALPIGLFNASSALAPALAPSLLTLIMVEYGWRVMFVIAGLAGFAVAAAWLLFYREPAQAGIEAADIAAIQRDDPHSDVGTGFAQIGFLLKFPTSWGMFLGYFGVVYMTWLYVTWLPGYLETQRHLSVASAGLAAGIPLGAGFFGAALGGLISNALGARGLSALNACRLPLVLGLLGAACFTLAGAYAATTDEALIYLACGLFCANVSSSCGWALAAVVAPPNSVATLEAIQNVGGSMGGILAPIATGFIVQATGSFVPALGLAAIIALVSAGLYITLVRRPV